MKFRLFFLVFIGFQLSIKAQYQINISYINHKDSSVQFRLSTFDEKLYIPKDTVQILRNKAKFSAATPVFGGIYTIYLPKSGKKIHLCIENKDIINLRINGENLQDSITTTDLKNKIFLQYQKIEQHFAYLDSQYNEIMKKGNASLKLKESLFKPKTDSLLSFRTNALKSLKQGSLLYKYFSWLNNLDQYAPNRQDYSGREKFLFKFPIQDPQLYFSPILKDILYEYLSSYPLNGDSILVGIDHVMKRLDCKDKAYSNTFNYFSTILQNSTIKNNINAYTLYIEKFLINNTCSFLKKERQNEFIAKYNQYKQLARTDTAINITLKDTSGTNQVLYDYLQKNDYTIICFYDPTCEHCKVQMPELDQMVKSTFNQTNFKIGVYAICNTNLALEKNWKDFIIEKELNENFIHVILGNEDKARLDYSAFSNPIFFLTDKAGTILLKKTTVSAIRKYITAQSKK